MKLDQHQTIEMLNAALATELVSMLRYRRHHFLAQDEDSPLATVFFRCSQTDLDHADWLADRIRRLGGAPDYRPGELLERGHLYKEAPSSSAAAREDLRLERAACKAYRGLLALLEGQLEALQQVIRKILRARAQRVGLLAKQLSGPRRRVVLRAAVRSRSSATLGPTVATNVAA